MIPFAEQILIMGHPIIKVVLQVENKTTTFLNRKNQIISQSYLFTSYDINIEFQKLIFEEVLLNENLKYFSNLNVVTAISAFSEMMTCSGANVLGSVSEYKRLKIF